MLRHLNIDEMVSLTAAWVSPSEAKTLFLSIPEIAPIHPKIIVANAELLAVQPVDDPMAVAMKELGVKAQETDTVHDALVRATVAGIEADRHVCLAARRPQWVRVEQLDRIRSVLFPSGLAIVNVSYLAEAGNAARVAALLHSEPWIGEVLESIPVRGGNLLELTRRFIAAGKKLGRLEHQRNVLSAKDATRPGGPAGIAAARSRWIRLVSQVLSNLELSDASEEAIETIRGPVMRASERAGRRYAERRGGERRVRDSGDEGTTEDGLVSANTEPTAVAVNA